MLKKITILVCLLTVQTILSLPAFAQSGKDLMIIRETNKVALVIGNSDYQNGFSKLNSPRNDAAAMARALKRLGFRLVGDKAHLDATFAEMETLVNRFTDELKNGGVGFFYFSGHGSQDNFRDNFLIPVDTPIRFKSDLKHKALKIEFVTSRMEETGNRLNILVLDACRNNPLPSGSKSGNKGLNTGKEVPSGVYIAFAARDGQVAADGDSNGYSLYTRELLENIETPNISLDDIFKITRASVKRETGNTQYPIDYESVDGTFYFKIEGQNLSAGNVPTNSNNISNRIKEAEEFFESGLKCEATDYDCKISSYTKAINLNPNFADAYNNRGVSYDDKKDYDAAIQDFTKAIELNPNSSRFYYNRGVSYRNKENYDAAIRDYTEAIKLNPNYADAYYNRGNSYRNKENYDAAIRDYTEAIKLNPKYSAAYNNRGVSYDDKKDYDAAIRDYTEAIKLNPNYADAYYNRGISYRNKENYDAAIRDYTEAIKLNPNDAGAYNNRGNAYDDKKDYDAAIRDFTEAIKLNPNKASYYNNRGVSYDNKKDYDAAIRDYTEAIKLNPKAIYYRNRAISYDSLGESAKAQADRKRADDLEKP